MKQRMVIAVAAVVVPIGLGAALLLSGSKQKAPGPEGTSAKAPPPTAEEPFDEQTFLESFGEGAAGKPVRKRARKKPAGEAPERRLPKPLNVADRKALLAAIEGGEDELTLRQRVYDLVSEHDGLESAPLLALWKKARSPQLKATLLWALGRVEGDADAIGVLETAAREELLSSLRLAAVTALLDNGAPAGRSAVRRVLAKDPDALVRERSAALLALHAADDPQTASALAELARADAEPSVRMAALEALATTPSQHALAVLEGVAENGQTKVEKTLAATLAQRTRRLLDPGKDLTAEFADETVHPAAKAATPSEETRQE